jgi:hypothetical protein
MAEKFLDGQDALLPVQAHTRPPRLGSHPYSLLWPPESQRAGTGEDEPYVWPLQHSEARPTRTLRRDNPRAVGDIRGKESLGPLLTSGPPF